MQIGEIPRVRLATLPTPLEEAPRLGEALGGIRLFVKRDDNTGLALGGNKARKLEFLMADAVKQGADTVITTGGPQSNHARMTAAAARKLGMRPVLVLEGKKPSERQGNLLLDELLGAEVSFVPEDADLDAEMARVAERLRAGGARPYIIPLGGSSALGSIGYVLAAMEIVDQSIAAGIAPDRVYTSGGSGGTLAGLLLGMKVFAPQVAVWGISVGRREPDLIQRIVRKAEEAARLAGLPVSVTEDDVHVDDDYVGPGYGIPSPECIKAIRLAAETEGLILDPVYTGKTLAGLAGHVKRGLVRSGETVVFLHTGGAPGLFAYSEWF
ncbi:MAG: D-cysteine desulfhydrase family protein [Firmicutes bacterium]|nr:D-cysteine desulfhydrase family protein [Bacillota bacterium]